MRISDWSSDVCSSDLGRPGLAGVPRQAGGRRARHAAQPRLQVEPDARCLGAAVVGGRALLRPADRPGGAVMSAVDVLAVLDLLSEHAGTLRPYAQDTGGFRVGNKGATELAAACAAAIRVAEARATVAELIDTTQTIRDAVVLRKARDVEPQWIDDQMQRLGKVLARAGGAS